EEPPGECPELERACLTASIVRLAIVIRCPSRRRVRGDCQLLLRHLGDERQVIGIERSQVLLDRSRRTCVCGLSVELGERYVVLFLVHDSPRDRTISLAGRAPAETRG